MNRSALFIALLLLFPAFAMAQSIVYVTPNGAGAQNGTSWSNALNGSSLRTALRQSPDFTQVWVAAGTYKPHPTVRDSTFFIHSNIKVYGGFTGNETQLSQRNWVSNPTILSGDIGIQNDTSDNSLHVVRFENAGDSTLLDGFRITGGNASGNINPLLDGIGGGILNYSNANPGLPGISSPNIRNCTIRKNFSRDGGGGVAEMLFNTCNTRYYKCVFDSNYTYNHGAALAIKDVLGGFYNATFDSCIFSNNQLDTTFNSTIGYQQGGAVALMVYHDVNVPSYGNPVFRNCIFDNNWAQNAGAIISTDKFTVTIENTIFRNNIARVNSVISGTNTNYRIRNCLFEHNLSLQIGTIQLATNYKNNRTKSEITNSIFRYNQSIYTIYIRATAPQLATVRSIDTTVISNCLFYHDSRDIVIMSEAASLGITNTTINNVTIYADNTQASQIWEGGLIFNRAYYQNFDYFGPGTANMTINNTIMHYPLNWQFSNNFSRAFKNLIYGQSGAVANATVRNSFIRSHTGSWPSDAGINGGGNFINTDPKFIDTAGHDYRLSCGSPAVNAGNSAVFPNNITTDVDGNARIYGSSIDIGCYEQQAVPMPRSIPVVTANGLTVTCSATSNMAIDSVKWSFGNNNFSTQLNTTYTFTTSGNKQICLTIYTACGSKDSCININLVCPLPVSNFTHTMTGRTGTFTYTGTTPTDSVVWNFGDNQRGTGNTVSHTYTTGGTFNVCATVYNACGNHKLCKNVVTGSVGIGQQPILTPIHIFPNPATHTVYAEGVTGSTDYRIYSNTGNLVQKGVMMPGRQEISVEGFPAGLYILEIHHKDGSRQHIRLIKS